LETATEAFEEDFDEDLKYLNSLHLPSSGLLINSTNEDRATLCVQSNSIKYSKNQSNSNSQLYSSPSNSSHLLAPARTRKLSKSSEDISSGSKSSNAMDNVFVPFAKLTKGLQSIGSNLDNKIGSSEATVANYQYVNSSETSTSQQISDPIRRNKSGLTLNADNKIVKRGTNSQILFI